VARLLTIKGIFKGEKKILPFLFCFDKLQQGGSVFDGLSQKKTKGIRYRCGEKAYYDYGGKREGVKGTLFLFLIK